VPEPCLFQYNAAFPVQESISYEFKHSKHQTWNSLKQIVRKELTRNVAAFLNSDFPTSHLVFGVTDGNQVKGFWLSPQNKDALQRSITDQIQMAIQPFAPPSRTTWSLMFHRIDPADPTHPDNGKRLYLIDVVVCGKCPKSDAALYKCGVERNIFLCGCGQVTTLSKQQVKDLIMLRSQD